MVRHYASVGKKLHPLIRPIGFLFGRKEPRVLFTIHLYYLWQTRHSHVCRWEVPHPWCSSARCLRTKFLRFNYTGGTCGLLASGWQYNSQPHTRYSSSGLAGIYPWPKVTVRTLPLKFQHTELRNAHTYICLLLKTRLEKKVFSTFIFFCPWLRKSGIFYSSIFCTRYMRIYCLHCQTLLFRP